MKPTLLILAAGLGSRYGGLKQLDSFGPEGQAIMDYSVYDAAKAGFGKAVFVIRPDFEAQFKSQLGARLQKQIPVEYAYQELHKLPAGFKAPEGREKPWGTGQALLMARDLIREPFAMINADDFYGRPGFEAMARYLAKAEDGAKADWAMVGYRLGSTLSEHGTVARGVCELGADGKLKAVEECTKIAKRGSGAFDEEKQRSFTGEESVSMNFFGFTPSVFGHAERLFEAFLKEQGAELKSEFYIPKAVDQMVKDGKAEVEVLKADSPWFGVTYQEDKPRVAESIRALTGAGLYPGI